MKFDICPFKIHSSMFNGDETSKENVEKQVLDVWDKLYDNWISRVRTYLLIVTTETLLTCLYCLLTSIC